MRWVPTAEAKVGMTLGEPVLDSNGRILATKGEKLSSQTLALLQSAGVREILASETAVTPEPPHSGQAPDQQEIAKITQAVQKKLDLRFRKFQGHPLMQTIRKLAEKQLIRKELAERPDDA